MRWYVAIAAAAAGCGTDVEGTLPPDAGGGPPGSPTVTVSSPKLGQSFYPTQSATIAWRMSDDDSPTASCVVEARSATSTLAVAPPQQVTSGESRSTSWTLTAVPPGTYTARVACTDANQLTGVGVSASFAVSGPPQQVSYATQIQPIWNASCNSVMCHDATIPAGGLDLTATRSHAQLVGVTSADCPATKRVAPGDPDASYLMHKLQGSGPCYVGSRMPKGAAALTADKLQLVRDWIFNGADP